jgi:purine-binding chemotaxis protein CheW
MTVHVRLRVGAEEYALPVEHVLEVVDVGSLAAVPGAPRAALGVRNLRGQILPVFDLAALLRIDGGDRRSRIVVAEERGRRVGLAVDDVSDVADLPEPAEETESAFLRGAVLIGEALVGVLDPRRLLDLLETEAAA